MTNEVDWREHLLAFDTVSEDNETDQELTLFRVGSGGAIFAAIEKSNPPTRISLRCDALLAKNLRQKYETVLPARKFNPSTWNTIIDTGQLSSDEIKDLVRLSYNLTVER